MSVLAALLLRALFMASPVAPPAPPAVPARTVVRVAVDPSQRHVLSPPEAPLRQASLTHGYSILVSQRTGMRFVEHPYRSPEAALQAICRQRAHLMLLMGPVEALPCPGLIVSPAYYHGHSLLAYRRDDAAAGRLESLQGRRVAVVDGGRYDSWLLARHPEIQRMLVPDLHTALAAVEHGVADAAIGIDVVMRPLVRSEFADSLAMGADGVQLPATLHLVVHERHRELLTRIDQALEDIHPAEHAALIGSWARTSYFGPPSPGRLMRHFRWELIGTGLLALMLVTGSAWLWMTQRSAQRHERRQARFIGMMSHDVRNAAQALVTSVDLLGLSRLDPGQRRLVDAAGAAGAGLRTLLSHAMDYSQLAAGAFRPAPQACDAAALLGQCVDALVPAATHKGVHLRLVLPPEPLPPVWIDPTAVRQIVNNLLGNALKFTATGSIEVAAVLQQRSDGHMLLISVADTGPGIAPDRQASVFEAFAQVRDTPDQHEGMGLGLSICRDIATAMDARITLRSTPGTGSCFTLHLPTRICASPAVPAAHSLPLAGRAILLVEDHMFNRAFVAEQLIALGACVTATGEGHAAVAHCAHHVFDVILLDCGLADIDGYRVARCVRERERQHGRARTPIVAISACQSSAHVQRCRAAGMDEVLCKPLDLTELLAVLLPEGHTGHAALAAWSPPPTLTARYLASLQEEVAALHQACQAQDLARLHYRAHRIAGVLRQLGHATGADIADDLHAMDLLDGPPWAEAARLLTYLDEAIAAVLTSAEADNAATAHAPGNRSAPDHGC